MAEYNKKMRLNNTGLTKEQIISNITKYIDRISIDSLKRCSKCKIEKKRKEFYRRKKNKDGRGHYCKACYKAHSVKYNSCPIRKQKVKEYNKERSKCPEIRRKNNAYRRYKHTVDPLAKFRANTRNLIKNSFKNNGYSKDTNTIEMLGVYSYESFRLYLRDTYMANYGHWPIDEDRLHKDHIVPLKTASTKEEIVKLNHWTNFQWLEPEDNIVKSARTCDNWMIFNPDDLVASSERIYSEMIPEIDMSQFDDFDVNLLLELDF